MIYDCFCFFNELDLLEIRLNTLAGSVDKFVLVEATLTHSGKQKPLYYSEHKERYKEFHKDIIHIVVEEYPEFDTSWTNENYQRNCIMLGLKGAKPDDTIIISDLDEIPRPETIQKFHSLPGIKAFQMNLYYYFVNCFNVNDPYWYHAKMLSYHDLLHYFENRNSYYDCYVIEKINHGTTPTKIRMQSEPNYILKNAGWHFSFCGGVDRIISKIESFAHQEFNKERFTTPEIIEKKIRLGQDIFDRKGNVYSVMELDNSFPEYLVQNQQKFQHLIAS
jgi:beta-1,4-mannosyl-glycoprotein beta-1,4-N-acetylglucosaminyltransferase